MLSHDCSVKRTPLVWIVDLLCGALLIGITIVVACRYGSLPDRIPIHYGADGVVDGYGAKGMVWVLVAVSWILVGIVSAVEQFPRFWNVPFKVTKENQNRVMTVTWHLISTIKLIVLGIVVYLTTMSVRGGNLSACLTLLAPIALVLNSLYWAVRLFLNRYSCISLRGSASQIRHQQANLREKSLIMCSENYGVKV